MKTSLNNTFSKKISGEWGDDDPMEKGVSVIRTANFQNDGKINFSKLVSRLIQKDARDEKGNLIKDSDGNSIQEIDLKKIEEKQLLDGDIIIEKSGGGVGTPVGRVVFFKNPDNKIYISNNFTQTLRVDNRFAVPRYIFYYLQYLYKKGTVLKYQNQTTGIFNLKLEKYFQEEIELPDVSLQFAVSTQLDSIQKLIEKRIKSIILLDNLIESIYFEMFGDPVNNQKNFIKKKLYQITDTDRNITRGIEDPGQDIDEGVSYIKTSHINKGNIHIREKVYTSEETNKKFARSICKTGDVIITIRASVGECAKITEEYSNYNITRGIALIPLNKTQILSEYILSTFLSDGFKYIINNNLKGSTFKQINLLALKEIKIPIPPRELLEEFEIIKINIIEQKEKLQQSLKILQIFFQAVLQKAFSIDTEIDEQLIFKELIKNLTLQDLKGNNKRLHYLIQLFEENKFDNADDYIDAKEKLFQLILDNEIEQKLVEYRIKLQVK